MKKEYSVLKGQDWELEYSVQWVGAKKLIAFHGFGQKEDVFDELAQKYLLRGYRVFSINLFFHGKSLWKKYTPISIEEWNAVFKEFLRKNDVHEFEIVAFSMGGKFALSLLRSFRPLTMTLLAPDGIERNSWYSLATSRFFLRGFFKRAIKKPSVYFGVVNTLTRIGVLDSRLKRFANSQMGTESNRRQVYNSWVMFRDLALPRNELLILLSSEEVDTKVYVGKYDSVVNTKAIQRILAKTKAKIEILECGHTNLMEKHLRFIEG